MPSGIMEDMPSKTEPRATMQTVSDDSLSRGGEAQSNEGKNDPKADDNEEGVEVVLGDERNPQMVDGRPPRQKSPGQDVFRHPQAVRPRAMRPPNGPPPPPQPYLHESGSWGGYGPPPPHGPPPPPHGDYHSRPYPVSSYNPSGSFDEHGYHHTPHYSPHVSYPGYRPEEGANVVSPHHKADPHYRPPASSRSRSMPPPQGHYYHYPPTSPVSRPGAPPSGPQGPPRVRSYAMRRGGDGPYSKAQRGEQYYPEEHGSSSHYGHPSAAPTERPHPTVVTETSFDSEHHSRESHSQHGSHPPTPASSHSHHGGPPLPPPPPQGGDHHYNFYNGGSWGSFDSAAGPPPHFDDQRYYGYPPPQESPYTPYGPPSSFSSHHGLHHSESFPPAHHYGAPPNYSYSYDDEEGFLKGYHPGYDHHHDTNPHSKKGRGTPKVSNKSSNAAHMLLPQAAEEVDFDVSDPPMSPITPPSEQPMCDSLAEVNGYDVLCGRGGGTNSQIGNRRFRQLVQDFQPTYLLARRKEKPLLARTIVLIIRKRGGRFLKKDEETGEMFEVGDAKAEAKTSQALREGLDVRATKSAASSLLEKKKKKQQQAKAAAAHAAHEDQDNDPNHDSNGRAESPPTIPRLHGEEKSSGLVHPHSPEPYAAQKRRRVRNGPPTDRFFPDFCPPRADLGRPHSPSCGDADDMSIALTATPVRRNSNSRGDDDDDRYVEEARGCAGGCAGIALDVMTGAATGSFCLGPSGWGH